MKKSKIKRKSKSDIRKIQDKLWVECRRLASIMYIHDDGKFHCFTCDKIIEGSNRQLGHFIAKSVCGAYLKYDMRNLRWQCYNCNINLGGNGAIFYDRLKKKCTQEYIDEIILDKAKTVKAYDHYADLLEKYKKL